MIKIRFIACVILLLFRLQKPGLFPVFSRGSYRVPVNERSLLIQRLLRELSRLLEALGVVLRSPAGSTVTRFAVLFTHPKPLGDGTDDFSEGY